MWTLLESPERKLFNELQGPPCLPHPSTASPIMPADIAVTICLAGSPPLRSFFSNYDDRCLSSAAGLLKRCEPLQPCLSSIHCSDAFCNNIATATDDGWMTRKKKKKSVVFADVQGLSLTAVHVFNEEDDFLPSELQFHLTELEGATAGLHLGDGREAAGGFGLVLDFTPPAADYLDLRNRLRAQQQDPVSCQRG